MKKFLEKGKKLYWWLIGTFAVLYLAVAFVSTLHAITFFQLANTLGLAILLGAAYEIGQAAVLFSILMSQNRNRLLAWGMMFLLTALQVTANVYASFKFIDGSGSNDWTYWQRAILFGVQAENDEMYKVIISWISGALLPIVALGMTALVADNIRMAQGDIKPEERKEDDEEEAPLWGRKKKKMEYTEEMVDDLENFKQEDIQDKEEELLEFLKEKDHFEKTKDEYDRLEKSRDINPRDFGLNLETESEILQEPKILSSQDKLNNPLIDMQEDLNTLEERIPEEEKINIGGKKDDIIKPVNPQRGWHFNKEFVDAEHNVFELGKFIGNDPSKEPTPPKPKKA